MPLLLAALPVNASAPADVSRLSSGVHVTGGAESAFDALPTTEWRVQLAKQPQPETVVTLPHPCDLSELVVVNSAQEGRFPGSSATKLELAVGDSAAGPWTPLQEFVLQPGTEPQHFELYVLAHLPPHKPGGPQPWVRQPIPAVRFLRLRFQNGGHPTLAAIGAIQLWGVPSR